MQDRTIIHQLRAGREQALTGLFRRYNRPLLYFALTFLPSRETAEEVVSDAFVKVWENRTRFESVDKIKAFLYIATKNACINHGKSAYARRQTVALETCESQLQQDADIFLKLVRTELLHAIFTEVDKLPEKQKAVFRMSFLEDLSTEEISEKLAISTSAVYTNRSRAIALLRNVIDFAHPVVLLIVFGLYGL